MLLGLAGMIPAPAEPVLPVNLKYSSSKVATDNEELEDFIGPYDIGTELRKMGASWQLTCAHFP